MKKLFYIILEGPGSVGGPDWVVGKCRIVRNNRCRNRSRQISANIKEEPNGSSVTIKFIMRLVSRQREPLVMTRSLHYIK